MVLLDTHALLWWTLDPEKLSVKAQKRCAEIVNSGACISSISIWELAVKIKNGSLDIGTSIEEYTAKLLELNCIEIVPVDENIWMQSVKLKWDHRDPADRVIVATALSRGLAIISKDEKIRAFAKNAIW